VSKVSDSAPARLATGQDPRAVFEDALREELYGGMSGSASRWGDSKLSTFVISEDLGVIVALRLATADIEAKTHW
jgi:hypothetical protein